MSERPEVTHGGGRERKGGGEEKEEGKHKWRRSRGEGGIEGRQLVTSPSGRLRRQEAGGRA